MRSRFLLLITVLALAVAGCAADDGADRPATDDAPAAAGQGLRAVATVYPLEWLVATIAPGAEITTLGAAGQDPHDLDLSPGERARLEQADLVAYLGPIGFQPQVERALESRERGVIDLAAAADGILDLDVDAEADDHVDPDHGDDVHGHDDHGHDDEDAHGDDGHAHGAVDPHLWFDARVMAAAAQQVGDVLAEIDPDHAETYRANAATARDELLALHDEVDGLLSDCALDVVVVSHEAYEYLLEPRGFTQEGLSGSAGHGEASPARLAALTRLIRDRGIEAVLAEPLEGRADAEALAGEAEVAVLEVSSLEAVTPAERTRGYPELLRAQAEAFATALQCAGAPPA